MECSICLQEYRTFIRLKCGHKFHEKCIKNWSQESYRCPLCRKFMGYFTLEKGDSLLPHFDEVYCLEVNSEESKIY